MTVARHYLMIAQDDKVEALRDALVALAAKVRPIGGCEGVALFQDAKAPSRFTFIEYWTSIDAHKAGGQELGKEALADVMAALAGPPEGAYLNQLPL